MDTCSTADSPAQSWAGFRTSQPNEDAQRPMWKGTIVCTAPDGRDECFAIGPDGFIWSYTVEHGEATGRLISTGLAGEVFGVARRGDGGLFVASGKDAVFTYVTEKASGERRWSMPRQVIFQAKEAELCIEKVLTRHHTGNLFVGVVLKVVEADGSTHHCLWEGVWSGTALVLANAPVEWAQGNAFWLESRTQGASALS